MKLKNTDQFLLRQLLTGVMSTTEKFSWKKLKNSRGRNQQALRAVTRGYGYHSYDRWFFF
jgi:hypothetical protein